MDTKTLSFQQSRRQFLSRTLPVGTLVCLGCSGVGDLSGSKEKTTVSQDQHKFLEDSGMSFQEVFDLAFKEFYIPIMKSLANEIGKDEFIETLKKARSELGKKEGQDLAKSLGKNDPAALAASVKENELYNNVLTYDIVEETDKALEFKITECLWAKAFREADAADIGYAGICHGDYALAPAFNPEMKMIRTKTLMQGHDCCNHRYVLEA